MRQYFEDILTWMFVWVASQILIVITSCGTSRGKRNPWQFRVDTLETCIPYRAVSRKHGTVNGWAAIRARLIGEMQMRAYAAHLEVKLYRRCRREEERPAVLGSTDGFHSVFIRSDLDIAPRRLPTWRIYSVHLQLNATIRLLSRDVK